MSTQAENRGPKHRWRFFRIGGFDQVVLDRGDDLKALDQLDQKLWVALACPTRGIEFDAKTLDLIDTDRDGRIRAPEILGAVKWTCSVLRDADILIKPGPELPLAAINAEVPEGAALLASAKRILADLGKSDATGIALADVLDTAKIFANTTFNGDGVVPPEASDDPALQGVMQEIITCMGGVADRSGKPGVSMEKVEAFYAAAAAYAAWRQQGEDAGASILPLGDDTAAGAAVLAAVRAKIDDYFTRCRLVAFDGRAAGVVNRAEAEYAALAAQDMSASAAELTGFPVAKIEADNALPLVSGLNPAWSAAVQSLRSQVVLPLLGEKDALTAAEWDQVKAAFAGYEAWMAAKAGSDVEALGLERVREILAGDSKARIIDLIAQDKALEPEANAIAQVEKLLRFHRDLVILLRNFVNFADFYGKSKAVFQAGTLYLDGRSCNLCMKVSNPAAHATMAPLSMVYLAYCDCTRPGTNEKMSIAAAFTGGDGDFLRVGRNGIFYDRQGRDWDATITKVVEQPISIRQAFWMPYKRFARFVGDQIEKFAAGRDKAVQDKAAAGAVSTGQKLEPGKGAAPPPAFDVAKFAGIFAAIGLALGALGSALVAVFSGLLKMPVWQLPLVFLAIILVISLPSMFLAWLKLRKRNLGPILDASGWAVNARARLNIPFGASLTGVAALPDGAERSLADPYAEKKSPWPGIILLLVLLGIAAYVLNDKGYIYNWFGCGKQVEPVSEQTVEGIPSAPAEAPAEAPAAP